MAARRDPAATRALAPGELARATTYRVVVEYDGTRYAGWQEQKNARTVAGVLRAAFAEVAGDVLDLGGAGRTDAGVHALGQVAHVRMARSMDATELARGVNERLPADVSLLALDRAAPKFHARHDALSRSYVYQIARRRSAFAHRYAWWIDADLDVAAMQAACATLVGELDYAAFGQSAGSRTSTRVRMDRAEVVAHGALVLVRFEASHFLWRMVRRTTGALAKLGGRVITPAQFADAFAGRALPASLGTVAEWTAPSAGLFLERVRYPGDAPSIDVAPAFAIGPRA